MRTARKANGNSRPGKHARPSSETVVGGPDLRFYHRADCDMAADRDWSAAPLGETAGRVPCGMCRP